MADDEGLKSYVVIHNIAKRHNVGTLARSATAFGVSEVILVGRRDFNSFGSHGSTSHIPFRHFYSLSDTRLFLKAKGCDICGVEITTNATSVTTHPFKTTTAFLLGNEGSGLSAKECEFCDYFVYIPQYGCGTASLNVTVAASIILHHFAGFPERSRDGNKFVVAERAVHKVGRNFCTETAELSPQNASLKEKMMLKTDFLKIRKEVILLTIFLMQFLEIDFLRFFLHPSSQEFLFGYTEIEIGLESWFSKLTQAKIKKPGL